MDKILTEKPGYILNFDNEGKPYWISKKEWDKQLDRQLKHAKKIKKEYWEIHKPLKEKENG
jgi:hypothetical protein